MAAAPGACGDDDDAAEASSDATAATGSGVEVTGAWARTSPANAEAGAAYLELTSADGDALVGASVDASVAGAVEVHETVVGDMSEDESTDMSAIDEGDVEEGDTADTDHEDMDDMDGTMTMQPVDSLELPAGETVVMQPGGLHVMLLELAEPLEAGDTFELTLDFETAEDQTVTVEVSDDAP